MTNPIYIYHTKLNAETRILKHYHFFAKIFFYSWSNLHVWKKTLKWLFIFFNNREQILTYKAFTYTYWAMLIFQAGKQSCSLAWICNLLFSGTARLCLLSAFYRLQFILIAHNKFTIGGTSFEEGLLNIFSWQAGNDWVGCWMWYNAGVKDKQRTRPRSK